MKSKENGEAGSQKQTRVVGPKAKPLSIAAADGKNGCSAPFPQPWVV